MKRFNKLYKQLMEQYEDDFASNWEKATTTSEELQVALDLMKHIKSKHQGEIYIVGGVPRDILMGNEIDDVDMATNIPFEKIAQDFDIRNISKNDSQPVYTILWKGYNFDLAKFREDSGDIGRQNNVSSETDSFEADTQRRDLTINSFGLDEHGNIVDYQGGLEDLKNKIVRAVGDAKKRFMEDATRILRVFRFAAKMDFDIEEKTKRAAIELKHLLQDPKAISQESISKEFFKSAKSGKTLANFLKKLQDTGILHDILPEFTSMEGFMHSPIHHPEGNSEVLGHIYECLHVSPYKDPVINLAVMLHDFGKATTKGAKEDGTPTYHGHEAAGVPIVENIFKRLRFAELSPQDKKNILAAVDKHMLIHNLDKLNIKTLTKLIQSPSWEIIKAVGYCDEASRGSGLFNKREFEEKIQRAEAKVSKIGGSEDETRKKLKQYISGNKLMEWFPILVQDKTKFKDIMAALQEYILERLDKGEEPDEMEMKTIAGGILKDNQFNEWVEYYNILTENHDDFWNTLKYKHESSDDNNKLVFFNKKGAVGYIEWSKDDGEVEKIYVGEPYRRMGVGTHIWDTAIEWSKENNAELPEHSSRRSFEGDSFAKSVGGYIPRLTDDIDGWSQRDNQFNEWFKIYESSYFEEEDYPKSFSFKEFNSISSYAGKL